MRKPLRLREAISGFVGCHQESNRGHKDFQSFALPTELWHHRIKTICLVCDPPGARTQDPNIKSVVLYLLS